MSSSSVFAVPSTSLHLRHLRPDLPRKRKRDGNPRDSIASSPQSLEGNLHTHLSRAQSVEYTVVVTPAERSQRRLAGLPLDQNPPPFPFPHSASHGAIHGDIEQPAQRNSEGRPRHAENGETQSLHSQHLSAMTAIVHRCMMTRDYRRAGRALGLILRNEVNGQAIDIRSEAIWGIGAEILLMQNGFDENASKNSQENEITREGFERAKSYYEHLIVQYPQHKTWPDAVNAVDFCIAMFGLWIYVTHHESLRLQRRTSPLNDEMGSNDLDDINMFEVKRWEYEQAKHIAEAMDLRMRNLPFYGNRELTRMRAMVSLWIADLIETCTRLECEDESFQSFNEQEDGEILAQQDGSMIVDARRSNLSRFDPDEATRNRKVAKALLERTRKDTNSIASEE